MWFFCSYTWPQVWVRLSQELFPLLVLQRFSHAETDSARGSMGGIPSTRHKSAPLKPCCAVWPTSGRVDRAGPECWNPCYSTDVYRLAGKSTGARTYPEYLSSPSARCLNTEIKESRAVTTRRLSAQRCFSVRTSCIGPCLLEVLHSSSVCSYI